MADDIRHPDLCCTRCRENDIACGIAKTTGPKGGPNLLSIGIKKCWGCSQRSQTPCSLTSDTGAARIQLQYSLRKHSWRVTHGAGSESASGRHSLVQAIDDPGEVLDECEPGPHPIAGMASDVAEAGGSVRDASSAVWHAVNPFVAGDLVMGLPRRFPRQKTNETEVDQTSTVVSISFEFKGDR